MSVQHADGAMVTGKLGVVVLQENDQLLMDVGEAFDPKDPEVVANLKGNRSYMLARLVVTATLVTIRNFP